MKKIKYTICITFFTVGIIFSQTTITNTPSTKYQTMKGWGVSLCWWANLAGGMPQASIDDISNRIAVQANLNFFRFNIGGGAFENSLTAFAICTGSGTAKIGGANVAGTTANGEACTDNKGINFFVNPVPFYPLAFNAFNNTGNSLSGRIGDNLAVLQSVGAVSFGGAAVPEPSSIALVGIATLALSLSGRRRRKSE